MLGVSLERSDTLAALCERLDRLPLALQLAASRLRTFAPEQLLDRLSQRLDLLKGGRDLDLRQQTLRATIDWSHELLPPEEEALFRRLAVFTGGCTLEAAETRTSPRTWASTRKRCGLVDKRRGSKKRTTIPDGAVAEKARDLLQRNFTATCPYEKWVADLTYIRTWNGFVYLAFHPRLLQPQDRRLAASQAHAGAELVLDALEMANIARLVTSHTRGDQTGQCPPLGRRQFTPTLQAHPHLSVSSAVLPTST